MRKVPSLLIAACISLCLAVPARAITDWRARQLATAYAQEHCGNGLTTVCQQVFPAACQQMFPRSAREAQWACTNRTYIAIIKWVLVKQCIRSTWLTWNGRIVHTSLDRCTGYGILKFAHRSR